MQKVEYENCTLYHGDCLEVVLGLTGIDAVISDPPYGMKWDGKVTRGKNGTGKTGPTKHHGETILHDDEPFDPAPWIEFEKVILWGSNHFGQRLPVGTTLVWLKRYDEGFGSFLSDAEVAWMKGGHGVYCKRDVSLQGESKERMHPTQKPVPLMAWCMDRLKVLEGETVLDPYMGSGTTGIACIRTGRKFVGIEKDEKHFKAACSRIEAELNNGRLF
jgi:DNA modification methylase